MSSSIKLVSWAVTISFVGSLPLGTLNLSVVNYITHHNQVGALNFSVAAIAVEMAVVRVALIALKKIERLKHFYIALSLLACLLLLALALNILAAAKAPQQFEVMAPFLNLHPIIVGALLSVSNPLHLPFWMGWTAVLKSKSILEDNRASYNIFVAAIGTGTALAFMVYGAAGQYLTGLIGTHQRWLNWSIGITLLLTALMQLYKSFRKWKRTLKSKNALSLVSTQ
jgi:hypothetical protein